MSYLKQDVFKQNFYNKDIIKFDNTNHEYKIPRPWQKECFEQFKNQRNWLVNAPMASGKTFLICCLAYQKLVDNPDLKVIISVPQIIIAEGFRKEKIQIGDKQVIWDIPEDLTNNTNTIEKLNNFLDNEGDRDIPCSRVALCTHATLVQAFDKHKDKFKNTLLVIDEAHHSFYQEEDEIANFNGIGSLVKFSIDNPNLNIELGLVTATFFRGDKTSIIPNEHIKKFSKYQMPYDKYLESCQYLKNFSFSFLLHDNDFSDSLPSLFEENKKTVVYIPYVNSKESLGDKRQDVLSVYKAISGKEEFITLPGNCLTQVNSRLDKPVKIVDLVDENNRKAKIDLINKDHKSNSPKIDVIMALGMFKEGANWKWAERIAIIGSRNSLTETIQMIGRLFRDVPGKESVEAHWLISKPSLDEGDVAENINNYIKCILLSLLLEEITKPTVLLSSKFDVFSIMDESNFFALQQKVMLETSSILDSGDFQNIEQCVKSVVCSYLESIGVDISNADKVTDCLIRLGLKKTLSDPSEFNSFKSDNPDILPFVIEDGIDVTSIDLNLIKKINPFKYLMGFITPALGINTFKELRDKIANSAFLNKQKLLEMAKNGEDRPSRYSKDTENKKLGNAIYNYTCKSSVSYNEEFFNKIKTIRPDWFEKSSDKNKQILLEMAKNKENRPSKKSKDTEEKKLGQLLVGYTCKATSSYDEEFFNQIKLSRPDWFENKNNSLVNKQKLFEMAKNKKNRPSQSSKNTEEKKLGKALSNYANQSSDSYDEDFFNQIKITRPDWFENKNYTNNTNTNKQKLLEMAKNKENRPSKYAKDAEEKKLGEALSNYTKKSSGSYDEDFFNKIKTTRSDWFENKNFSEENKQKLFEMAKNKKNRPNSKSKDTEEKKLGNVLSHYTIKSSSSYDETFTNEIKTLRPDWFKK